MTFDDAQFDAFLEDITQPFLTADIARWAARIHLPFTLITQTGPVTLRSQQDIEENFALYLLAMKAMRADLIVREKISSEPCQDGTVITTYRSNFLRNGVRIRDPYTASALLHFDDGLWRMSSILNALGHHQWTGKHPNLSGEEKQ